MKFWNSLLAIYILTLNLMSCGDTGVQANDDETRISQVFGDNHENQGADLCSPFCNCHCCHVHATNFNPVAFETIPITIPTDVFFHFYGSEKSFNTSILQPPQA